jgi:hypothetical protein
MIVTNNESTRLARELHALKAIAKAITSPLELPELLDLVMKTIISVLEQAEVGAIMLWDQPSGLFRPEAAFGYDLGILREIGLQASESITGKVFDDGQAHLFAEGDRRGDGQYASGESHRDGPFAWFGRHPKMRCGCADCGWRSKIGGAGT